MAAATTSPSGALEPRWPAGVTLPNGEAISEDTGGSSTCAIGRAHVALGERMSLAEIAKLGWVLPQAKGAFHRQIEALFLSAEVTVPENVIRCDSLLTSKAIVRDSRRVTVLPRGAVAAELSMGVLRALPIEEAAIVRTIGIQMLRGRLLSGLASRFVEEVQRHSAAL